MGREGETPSDTRLILLLKGYLREVMNRECANQASIYLYYMESYWVMFKRSVH